MTALIDEYLTELRHALWTSSPLKERLLCEVEEHLREGTERERERGVPPEEAERRAIERFGPPPVVAQLLTPVLAAKGATRMRLGFMQVAEQAMRFASEEAARRGHAEVGTEHLLLGLMRQENSCAVIALSRLGITPEQVRSEIERRLRTGKGTQGGRVQFSPAVCQALDLAHEEAEAFDLYFVSTEHLLLGLIREGEGLAAQLLTRLGAALERTREQVRIVFAHWIEIVAAQQRRDQACGHPQEAEARAEYLAFLARL